MLAPVRAIEGSQDVEALDGFGDICYVSIEGEMGVISDTQYFRFFA